MNRNTLARRYALILTTGVIAIFLLTLSWPRLRASLRYLPVDTAISNYWQTRDINFTQLDGLIGRAHESIAIHDHYRYWEGMSELHLLRGQDMSKTIWIRRQSLQQSITAAEEVLKRAPLKPRTWLRIARAKEFLVYPANQVIPALKMSILTGRVEPTLMLPRLELGLRYLQVMESEAIVLLRDQAVLTWSNEQQQMLKQIKSGFLDAALLRELLSSSNSAIIADMENQLEQSHADH